MLGAALYIHGVDLQCAAQPEQSRRLGQTDSSPTTSTTCLARWRRSCTTLPLGLASQERS